MACFRAVKPADPSSERRSPAKDSPVVPSIGWASEGKSRPDSESNPLQESLQRRGASEASETPVNSGRSGTRNLIAGVVILLVALGLLFQGLLLLGSRAALPLGTALVTFVALFVLSRTRLLRQRNGSFLALAVVCLLSSLVALAEYGGYRLAGVESSSQGGKRNTVRGSEALPLLSQAYEIPPATGANATRFKVLRDLRVVIDEKPHLIKAGEVFPVSETGDGEVRFLAGNQQIALPVSFVEIINPVTEDPGQSPSGEPQLAGTTSPQDPAAAGQPDPAAITPEAMTGEPLPEDETPSQATQRAQKEAIRRYPALGMQGSPENQLFIETYQELKHSGADDFFADPQWPLQLAELLAKRENWQRQE